MDKRLLPWIKIGEHDIEAGMGTHRRERTRQGRLADASLLTDEGDYRGHGCVLSSAVLMIEPGHDLMQPPSHPAFADFDAFRKLVLFLEPEDVLRGIRHQAPQLASRNDSRKVFSHGSASFL
jgi:hypothetical protein